MKSTHQDPENFYKEFEKEWNMRVHTYTNSLTFTHAFGKALEKHLDLIVIQQKVIKNWLSELDIPNKEEFVTLAGRKVDCLEKIDSLEETMYELNMDLKKDNTELKKLNTSLSDMLYFMENEWKNVKVCKIKTLENELDELKKLFNN
ncbi:hypothetical protein [Neobacillus sp. CF12]|uniref:hypothetical protein n=1 Tax=Neobacillus sp. CF12 TaxID=3055864 RepID=UPI0025A07F51|nr:hypothetical protein [Neobacillus sp. CF12]MDM5328213.1 hypothetical protein [Neobacillus sp. CF12]